MSSLDSRTAGSRTKGSGVEHEDAALADVRCEAVEMCRGVYQCRTDDLAVHGSVPSY